jgi:hypothetical protein
MKNCTIPTSKTVAAYKDFDFERIGNGDVPENCQGDYPHANFFKKVFIPIVRKELKALAKRLGMSIKFNPMYFEWSAYFGKNGKYIYVHCDDVRWNNWYDEMYYRTVENDHDCHGGPNNWTSYDKLEQCLTRELG